MDPERIPPRIWYSGSGARATGLNVYPGRGTPIKKQKVQQILFLCHVLYGGTGSPNKKEAKRRHGGIKSQEKAPYPAMMGITNICWRSSGLTLFIFLGSIFNNRRNTIEKRGMPVGVGKKSYHIYNLHVLAIAS